MKVTEKEIIHLANLSALNFSTEELKSFSEEFNRIAEFINQIQEANTGTDVEFGRKIELENLRADVAQKSLDNAFILQNAPDKKGNSFKVPKVVG